jgi:hypothetical protein
MTLAEPRGTVRISKEKTTVEGRKALYQKLRAADKVAAD